MLTRCKLNVSNINNGHKVRQPGLNSLFCMHLDNIAIIHSYLFNVFVNASQLPRTRGSSQGILIYKYFHRVCDDCMLNKDNSVNKLT